MDDQILFTEQQPHKFPRIGFFRKRRKLIVTVSVLLAAIGLGTAILLSALLPKPVDDLALFRQGLVPVKVGDKWGYANTRGKLVIQPQYRIAYLFDESGLAAVKPENSVGYGFINTRGKLVIEPKFYLAEPAGFSQGLAPVRGLQTDLWGYIDTKGNFVIPPQFQYAGPFTESGIAAVQLGRDSCYIDKEGNFVDAPPANSYVNQEDPFPHLPYRGEFAANGLAWASEDYRDQRGYIDRTGNLVIPRQFAYAGDFGDNGLACVREEQDGLYGYIDSTGQYVIPPQFDYAHGFEYRPVAIVTKDGLYGLIDSRGKYVLQPQAMELWGFGADGLCLARDGNGYTVVDQTGQPLFTERFDEILRSWDRDRPLQVYFSDGYAIVKEAGKYGVIDKKGRYVLEPEFDAIRFPLQ